MSTTATISLPRPVTWTDEHGEHFGITIGHDVDGLTRVREYASGTERAMPADSLRPGKSPQRFKVDLCAELADGWWGRGSKAVRRRLLVEAEALLGDLETSAVSIAPTTDGGLVLEWTDAHECACSADLDIDGSMYLVIADGDLVLTQARSAYDRATLAAFVRGEAMPSPAAHAA